MTPYVRSNKEVHLTVSRRGTMKRYITQDWQIQRVANRIRRCEDGTEEVWADR
mgnify:CR=1 FL=1